MFDRTSKLVPYTLEVRKDVSKCLTGLPVESCTHKKPSRTN